MTTITVKALVNQSVDIMQTKGMAERSQKLATFKRMLSLAAQDGTQETLGQISELIALGSELVQL